MQKSSMKRRQREVQLNGEHRVSDAFFFFFYDGIGAHPTDVFFREIRRGGKKGKDCPPRGKEESWDRVEHGGIGYITTAFNEPCTTGHEEEQFRVSVRIWIEENTRRIGFFIVNIIIKFRGFTIVKSNITRIKIQAIV